MSDQPAAVPLPERPHRKWAPFRWFTDNPIIIKELRGRMRGRGAFFLLTAYLALISLVIGLVYASMAEMASYSPWDPGMNQAIGKAIFGTVVMMELLLVSLIGPALTSGAITSEREHQTLDLLRTTTLSTRSLVFGKLGSAVAFLLLLIFAALPIESIAFVLGGVALEEIVISTLLLVVTALFHCALGLFFSSFLRRTSGATVSSYGAIILSYVLLVVFFFISTLIENSFWNGSSYPLMNTFRENLFVTMLWLLVSSNPLLAAGVSEIILVENQSIFLAPQSYFGYGNITLLSPWIPFTLIYISLTLLLILLSLLRVRRPDR